MKNGSYSRLVNSAAAESAGMIARKYGDDKKSRELASIELLPSLSSAEAEVILTSKMPSWVLDLGLLVEKCSEHKVILRLPWSNRLAREGEIISGAVMMTAADTAAVVAISAACKGYIPMATIQQSTSFKRPVGGEDLLVEAVVGKLGHRIAFVDIVLISSEASKIAATVSSVFSLRGR
ncbi:PaaI family thioesterase [Streptomyces sp. NPDC005574]|uniref:PaaI family thioesterase n=1 Tax=Streptomyces sp. NPDC005574 TaxID=3156891 RepID=UPI0033B1398B